MARIIIACEFSGIVRDAFIAAGHDAISCDILPTEREGPHIQDDIRNIKLDYYDCMIAHPPCTHLAVCGAAWFYRKEKEQEEALSFIRFLLSAPVKHIALENPIGIISTRIRKPDQIIQPCDFGHTTTKATCLWLSNLPKLTPTDVVEPEFIRIGQKWRSKWEYSIACMPKGIRGHERSRTFPGIAAAMAAQWGSLL